MNDLLAVIIVLRCFFLNKSHNCLLLAVSKTRLVLNLKQFEGC